MSTRAYLFAWLVAVFVLTLTALAIYYQQRAKRAAGQSWTNLLKQLRAVDRYSIALIAADLLPGAAATAVPHPELEPEEIWDLIGGMAGLETLAANCEVLVALACHIQQTYPEALPVAEQLRLNAREIQWHLERLRSSERAEKLHAAFPNYAQRAVSTYYVMTQTVLALYASASAPGYPELQKAL